MIELFVFVNPIGNTCLNTERLIMTALNRHAAEAHLTIIPLTNLTVVSDYLKRRHLNMHDLALRNDLTQITQQAVQDVKTASLQGMRRGRSFLMTLQHYINIEGCDYTAELVDQICQEVGLDLDMFHHDQNSDLVQDLVLKDQEFANDMAVKSTPATIMIDYRCDPDGVGYLVDGLLDDNTLETLLNPQPKAIATSAGRQTAPLLSTRTSLRLL